MSTGKRIAREAGRALVWIVGLTVLGAALGAVAFPLWGLAFGLKKTAAELALFGARTLGFYFLMWAPGIALVAGVMRAYERRQAGENKRG